MKKKIARRKIKKVSKIGAFKHKAKKVSQSRRAKMQRIKVQTQKVKRSKKKAINLIQNSWTRPKRRVKDYDVTGILKARSNQVWGIYLFDSPQKRWIIQNHNRLFQNIDVAVDEAVNYKRRGRVIIVAFPNALCVKASLTDEEYVKENDHFVFWGNKVSYPRDVPKDVQSVQQGFSSCSCRGNNPDCYKCSGTGIIQSSYPRYQKNLKVPKTNHPSMIQNTSNINSINPVQRSTILTNSKKAEMIKPANYAQPSKQMGNSLKVAANGDRKTVGVITWIDDLGIYATIQYGEQKEIKIRLNALHPNGIALSIGQLIAFILPDNLFSKSLENCPFRVIGSENISNLNFCKKTISPIQYEYRKNGEVFGFVDDVYLPTYLFRTWGPPQGTQVEVIAIRALDPKRNEIGWRAIKASTIHG